jgi:hypothetical protein
MEPLRVSSQHSDSGQQAGRQEPVQQPSPPEDAGQAFGAGPAFGAAPRFGAPPGPGATLAPGVKSPWKSSTDGKTVFRLGTQFIIWWAWVAFAIFNVFELVLRDRDYFSIEVIAALLALTGLAYACALRPKVLADDRGVVVRNPFQDHEAPWGAVKGVYLGDSVEFTCARPAPKKDKTVYCWALYSGKRKRMRAQMQRSFMAFKTTTTSRAPADVKELSRLATVQVMAAELGRRATQAKEDGAPDGVVQSSWYWPALVAFLAPSAALLGLLLAK